MHPVLADARTLDGRPRFYPPGDHPATFRIRRHLAELERLPSSPSRDEVVAYLKEQVAAFEGGESLAKAVYLQRVRGFV